MEDKEKLYENLSSLEKGEARWRRHESEMKRKGLKSSEWRKMVEGGKNEGGLVEQVEENRGEASV